MADLVDVRLRPGVQWGHSTASHTIMVERLPVPYVVRAVPVPYTHLATVDGPVRTLQITCDRVVGTELVLLGLADAL